MTDSNESTSELDMSNDPVVEGLVPNWDEVQDKADKMKQLDDKTLSEIYRQGMANRNDMYSTMDSALASSELQTNRDYQHVVEDGDDRFVKGDREI